MTPRDFLAASLKAHEGGLSLNASDNGNWFDPTRYKQGLPQKRNMGKLVGSKFGVTAYALAQHRKLANVTAADIASIAFDEAVDIAVDQYVDRPGLGFLAQNRVTLSVIDKGYISGPGQAIKLLQRLIGANDDGKIGKGGETVQKYAAWIAKFGEEACARSYCQARIKFDTGLATDQGPNDHDRIFLNGWNNRSQDFLPGTKWWKASA
jgi:lysozyme family protein